ncbi:unannotated protein [freshwater metagenome]|uniref:Unannotated protein n=1 Tax=freshwater metagenome TaxID=449393 RepID=A0A6J6ZD09_9ZZZZ
MNAHPVISHLIVQARGNAQDALIGTQLNHSRHYLQQALRLGCRLSWGTRREQVLGVNTQPASKRSLLNDLRPCCLRLTYYQLGLSRTPVVGISHVYVVNDVTVTSLTIDREGSVLGVDLNRDQPVCQAVGASALHEGTSPMGLPDSPAKTGNWTGNRQCPG